MRASDREFFLATSAPPFSLAKEPNKSTLTRKMQMSTFLYLSVLFFHFPRLGVFSTVSRFPAVPAASG